ncbi:MAG: prepilin-type N-terminal cleavage/methylation domain-containing protein [Polyangiales bacterium]
MARERSRRRRRAQSAFTLLEVMVALAILGLSLTAILSAQAGLYDANIRARNVTLATVAARCKMNELEVHLIKDGYPLADETDEGQCCDDESPHGMSCRWQIETVELPDPPAADLSGGGGGDGGTGGGGGSPLTALMNMTSNPAAMASGGIAGVSDMLAQGTGPNGMGGAMGIAGMALTMVYPTLRPLLEASIRRVTVEVVWNEGPNERVFKVVQFVTNPSKGLPPNIPGMMGDAGVPGLPGLPNANGLPGGGLPGGGLPAPGLPMGLGQGAR